MPVQRHACSQPFMNSSACFSASGVRLVARLLCLVVVALSLVAPARALEVEGLYSHAVAVDQSQNDEMSRALAGVLVKVSGRREVLSDPVIRKALAQPESYVQKFGFQSPSGSGRPQYFQADFNEQAINDLLRSAGQAIWGATRSSTIVWLALDSGRGRAIVGSSGNLAAALTRGFHNRGVPVLLPLLDVDDVSAISAVDLWGGFHDKIRKASRRYGSESILTGRLTRSGDLYSGRLSLLFRDNVAKTSAVNGLDAAGVARLAADMAGSTLSAHYAIDASQNSGNVVLQVENIVSLEAYAALGSYLEQITAVREVSVRKVGANSVELVLAVDGSQQQLVEALALEGRLVPVVEPVNSLPVVQLSESASQLSEPAVQPSEPAPMVYRWVARR